ncbi:ClbS/DfsB family four-helix bundle protein [Parasphingorhabdus cellanae]|uniref:ClbS/DfsB family four-helix bundle protein n=1 Tax=Parasphingorhabdus cellanae TaxID=2806553 RepID=A0ABX7T4K3_9SPHN|nr:ClbS/DfsB family four-helix bundle protein [Parasphingorhabdus cellanae]QTD54913.1 ClbS/DfsB family four-helix bundle protein [Parasphingorhabdus cellanae]
MAAENKSELHQITRAEYQKLERLISAIDSQTALHKDEENTSIKDVISHRAHWIALFFNWYSDGMAGKTVYFPAKGYKWNDLKRYNAELRKKQADISWDEAVLALKKSYEKLLDFIETHSDRDLYDGPMKGANNKWTPGRWAEAAGASHFRSASKYVRVRLRELK